MMKQDNTDALSPRLDVRRFCSVGLGSLLIASLLPAGPIGQWAERVLQARLLKTQ